MKTEQVLPFASNLVESTRAIGYSFESAVADVIDNSIAKDAHSIDLFFDSMAPRYLAIVDDGSGMSYDELIQAMRYGSQNASDKRPANDLGRFGLGLKMASLSQCRKLTVVSKKDGCVNGARWDLDLIYDTNDWTLQLFSADELRAIRCIDKLQGLNSGTMVLWEDFDRLEEGANDPERVFDEKLQMARRHIGLVFHRFLEKDGDATRIKISMNQIPVSPLDPFLRSNPATQRLEDEFIPVDGGVIKVKPYVLPYRNKLSNKEKSQVTDINDLRQEQGFYVYRNKRLIVWGTWFRLVKAGELNKLARICVDIPNSIDSMWNIDIKKSAAALPDSIKDKLRSIVERTVGSSERVYRYRGRKINDSMEHVWNLVEEREKTYRYYINRDLPIYKKLEKNLSDEDMRTLSSFIEMIEASFPYTDVYMKQAKEHDIDTSAEDDAVFHIGIENVEAAKRLGIPTSTAIKNLAQLDYFANHKEVLTKLEKEYADE